ncbi:leucine--tRNA ligase [bacterium]|nr:leucine--tRNA ligase [bacterium]
MAIETYYPFQEAEPKWQQKWAERGLFRAQIDGKRPKAYVLEQFPYPSGKLHMGHVRVYTIGDAMARFRRMQGFDVLHPMGFDAFGLPAENAAIQRGVRPADWTEQCIDAMRAQLDRLGMSYDWDREVVTCRDDYYRWNQWIFIKMWEQGLVERRKAAVNWCPKCQTVLANEQVINGRCWRHEDTEVDVRQLDQWFLKITDYADELLRDLDDKLAAWPNLVTAQQRNWIGRSEGALVKFKVKETGEDLPIFTTRPDTLFGVSFMVMAPEHPKVQEWITGRPNEAEVKNFINKIVLEGRERRTDEAAEKEGCPLGITAINPVNGREVPIWIANFVLMEYGTGAIMAVPAHDQRDFEFAKKFNIPIHVVIEPEGQKLDAATMTAAYTEPGKMVNSAQFDGMDSVPAKRAIVEWLAGRNQGEPTVQYRLRDWLISRQRFWGTPIPFIYCEHCGLVPVSVDELPVKLPKDAKFGDGSPLAGVPEFVNVTCSKCGGKARRETDTMDTFFDSSWYFLRYCDAKNAELPFGGEAQSWMPVDLYVGGKEHAILHLLYSRFFTKVLRDMGLIKLDEPFSRLLTQGMVLAEGRDPRTGDVRFFKMSKSIGNVVDPSEIIGQYGADAARMFILFAAPPDKDLEWTTAGVEGIARFMNRLWRYLQTNLEALKKGFSENGDVAPSELASAEDRALLRQVHETTRRVTLDMGERQQFNTAISACMELLNALYGWELRDDSLARRLAATAMSRLALLISPFAPHLAEEIWSQIGAAGLVAEQPWPEWNQDALRVDEIEIALQVMGKVRGHMMVGVSEAEEAIKQRALADEKVKQFTDGKTIRKVVYVKNKLVNVVAN